MFEYRVIRLDDCEPESIEAVLSNLPDGHKIISIYGDTRSEKVCGLTEMRTKTVIVALIPKPKRKNNGQNP